MLGLSCFVSNFFPPVKQGWQESLLSYKFYDSLPLCSLRCRKLHSVFWDYGGGFLVLSYLDLLVYTSHHFLNPMFHPYVNGFGKGRWNMWSGSGFRNTPMLTKRIDVSHHHKNQDIIPEQMISWFVYFVVLYRRLSSGFRFFVPWIV